MHPSLDRTVVPRRRSGDRSAAIYFGGGVDGRSARVCKAGRRERRRSWSPPDDSGIKLSALEGADTRQARAARRSPAKTTQPLGEPGAAARPRRQAARARGKVPQPTRSISKRAASRYKGQEAVAQVVMNRVFSGYYPHDVCGVVYQNAETASGLPVHLRLRRQGSQPDRRAGHVGAGQADRQGRRSTARSGSPKSGTPRTITPIGCIRAGCTRWRGSTSSASTPSIGRAPGATATTSRSGARAAVKGEYAGSINRKPLHANAAARPPKTPRQAQRPAAAGPQAARGAGRRARAACRPRSSSGYISISSPTSRFCTEWVSAPDDR